METVARHSCQTGGKTDHISDQNQPHFMHLQYIVSLRHIKYNSNF